MSGGQSKTISHTVAMETMSDYDSVDALLLDINRIKMYTSNNSSNKVIINVKTVFVINLV